MWSSGAIIILHTIITCTFLGEILSTKACDAAKVHLHYSQNVLMEVIYLVHNGVGNKAHETSASQNYTVSHRDLLGNDFW